FNLLISNPDAGIASVIVSDLNGRKLLTEQYPVNINSNKFTIDLSGLSKGIYLVNVLINGSNLSKKLVLL
ncbi:MAG TPA: T9SS type A sorting domain-containing protein, partial [Prolixibacteraceae bacterium]